MVHTLNCQTLKLRRVDENSPGLFVVHRVREGGANRTFSHGEHLNYHMYLVLYLYCPPCLNMVYIIVLLSYALDTPCAEQHPEAQY